MSLKLQRAREWLMRKSRHPRKSHPLATVLYYGPTDQRATKVAAAVLANEYDEPLAIERWFVDRGDIRRDDAVLIDLTNWLKLHDVQRVVTTSRIAGCPHEEGVDYPDGEACPHCPFWANRARFLDGSRAEALAVAARASDAEPGALEYSVHCRAHVHDGATLDVQIYRMPHGRWSLEVLNEAGTSIVWDELFDTDDAAWAEFERTLKDEGLAAFGES